ncbi:MAG TPA: hypothetical protein VJY39_03630 [Acidisphaera sp.]|nr:hypothetical protein [Acidisphaera sp.]
MILRVVLAAFAALGFFIVPAALAQTPASPSPPPASLAPPNTPNGARPGNEIGTGSSLPLGSSASNINPSDTPSTLAPNLPSPPIGENASPREYLMSARGALAAGRTGEAQQSMEMAETRTLDRSVAYNATMQPDDSRFIQLITQALQALASGDRSRSLTLIDQAMPLARS